MVREQKEVKKITAGFIFSWIFGVIFLFAGMGLVAQSSYLSGILVMVCSAMIIPYFNKLSSEKFNFEISGGIKFILVIVIFILMGIGMSNSGDFNSNVNIQSTDNIANQQNTQTQPSQNTRATTTPAQTTTPAEEEYNRATMGEKNALSKAKSYLRYSAFSYKGLIKQLEFEGFTNKEAKYGTDNSGADWNEQAKLKAESYLKYSAFSRQGLIDQLLFEGFTQSQAEYGVNAVGY